VALLARGAARRRVLSGFSGPHIVGSEWDRSECSHRPPILGFKTPYIMYWMFLRAPAVSDSELIVKRHVETRTIHQHGSPP